MGTRGLAVDDDDLVRWIADVLATESRIYRYSERRPSGGRLEPSYDLRNNSEVITHHVGDMVITTVGMVTGVLFNESERSSLLDSRHEPAVTGPDCISDTG